MCQCANVPMCQCADVPSCSVQSCSLGNRAVVTLSEVEGRLQNSPSFDSAQDDLPPYSLTASQPYSLTNINPTSYLY